MIIAPTGYVNGFAQANGEMLDFANGFRTLMAIFHTLIFLILQEENNGNGEAYGSRWPS